MQNNLEQSIASLRSIERRIKPDAAWVRARRDTLFMQVKNTLPTNAATYRERLHEAIRHFVAIKGSAFVWKPMMTLVSLFILATGGSIMSVSAAEQSLPGDFLYGLKLATEQARLAWVSEKNERLKLKTEFTDRRVHELKEVANVRKDSESVRQVAESIKRDLSTIKDQLADVKKHSSPEVTAAAARLVDKQSINVMNVLQETKVGLGKEMREKVTEAQTAAAETGVKAIEVLAEKHQQSSSTVSAADLAKTIETHTNAVIAMTNAAPPSVSMTSGTMSILVQSIASSTASGATSTLELPKLIDQVKNLTTQVFAQEKVQEKAREEKEGKVKEEAVTASSTILTTQPSNTTAVPTSSSHMPKAP